MQVLYMGMVFTYDSAFDISDGALKFKIKFNQIAKMERSNDKKVSRYPVIKFSLLNGKKVELRCGLESNSDFAIAKMWKLFSEICNCINRYRDNNSKIEIIE